MTNETKQPAWIRGLLVAAGLVIVVAGMRAAQGILVPFVVSTFLAVVVAPPLLWMQRRGVPSVVAVLIVVLGLLLLGTGIGALVGSSLNDFSNALPGYQERLQAETGRILGMLEERGIDVAHQPLMDVVDPGAAMRLVGTILKALGGILTNAFLILLTVIFILLEAASFPAKVRAALGDPKAYFAHFSLFTDNLKRYLAIKTIICLITGVAVTIWVWALGVDFPLLWGLVAFLLNYVPSLGSIIAAVPAVLLAFIQFGIGRAVVLAAGYVVVNVVLGNFVEPRYQGRGLGLSTLVVFLSLVIWGWIWGPVGMLLSVPLTMTVKIAFESSEETRWIAVLLGSEAEAAGTPPLASAGESGSGS